VPESGSLGFVRGALSNERPYRDLTVVRQRGMEPLLNPAKQEAAA